MMRGFVVISDLHAHPWAAFAKGSGANNSRLRRTLEVLDASLAYAQVKRVPWLFGGDIVHTAGYALNEVMAELIAVFERYPDVPKLAVWGNHDARGVGGKITLNQTVWAALAASVSNLTVLGTENLERVEVGGLTFAGAGAQPSMEHFAYASMASDVGLYHGTVRGSIGPSGYVFEQGHGCLEPRELLGRHRVAIVGDVHYPQQIEAPSGQAILIPGAPEHHDFGDRDVYGWWFVELPPALTENPRVQFIPGGSSEFRTVETPDLIADDFNYYRVRSVPFGAEIPENAVAPRPLTIADPRARGASERDLLLRWVKKDPPACDQAACLEIGRGLLSVYEPRQLQAARFARVGLVNFCSYEDQGFNVRDGTWLVVGKGRDFPSNGAGKSSLFEAIYWLIFGRTTKGLTGDEVIRRGALSCAVAGEIEFDDGSSLMVTRSRGARSSLSVIERGEAWEAASVTEMTEKLTERLGLTPELYQALGYFSQERLVLFASATDGERKTMLADLLGLAAYQDASALAQKNATALEQTIQRDQAAAAEVDRSLVSERGRLVGVGEQSDEWAARWRSRMHEANTALAYFESKRAEEREAMLRGRQATSAESHLALLKSAVAQLSEKLQLPAPAPFDDMAALMRARAAFQENAGQVHTIRAQLQETGSSLTAARAELERVMEAVSGGLCPTCSQNITPDHRAACEQPYVKKVRSLEARRSELIKQQATVVQVATDLTAKVVALEEGVRRADERKRVEERLAQTQGEIVHAERAALEAEALSILHVDALLDQKAKALADDCARVGAEGNPFLAELGRIQERIEKAEASAAAYADQRQKRLLAQSVQQYWARGFSKQGIQSLLMDEIAVLFNEARGSIFPALTQGVYDVQLSTLSETKGGEWRERTEFSVFERGTLVPYASLSGGQRRRIDVGVMLVLVRAVSRWMQVPGVLGLLVLDEVFGFLDASGAEGLMEALREVQADVPAIYAITHDPQLQALFSNVVVVEQDQDGVSRIVEA